MTPNDDMTPSDDIALYDDGMILRAHYCYFLGPTHVTRAEVAAMEWSSPEAARFVVHPDLGPLEVVAVWEHGQLPSMPAMMPAPGQYRLYLAYVPTPQVLTVPPEG